LRIGFEESAPVQAKRDEAYIPSMKEHRDLFARDGSLRSFNALERFREIEERVHGDAGRSLDLSQSAALVARIGEYDPAVHGELGRRPAEAEAPIDLASSGASEPTEPAPRNASVNPVDRRTVETTGAPHERRGGVDQAERTPRTWLPVAVAVEAGDVLAFDIERPGELRPAASMADPGVVGIAAGPSRAATDGGLEVALVDALYGEVKADAGYGAIRPGDLLVSSPTSGHVMRAIEVVPGTVLGKAIDTLDTGTGTIRVQLLFR
jgi:hypothetical protein